MNDRWQHKVVDVPYKLFESQSERAQAELDRHGAQGWELVSALQSNAAGPLHLFFKKRA
ncbi:DUF4177 domain-containing protein [Lysobacter sp. SG-8]|uniref:DUF4177 domain-containing protein n=1 Tax=Marilutibacter penaei TaxID=2759900 RepID=A0A7W3U1T9_9GAMM|nr:DUF4177 domain-containing protein [Lysobacter penaei]MBB1087343.1 DUF4177 domain-containing protein [Lysobacter penaei]